MPKLPTPPIPKALQPQPKRPGQNGNGNGSGAMTPIEAGAVAVGWGGSAAYETAKTLARGGDAGATAALVECCGRALDQRL